MARSFDQIVKEYRNAEIDYKRFNKKANSDGTYTLDGRRISASEYRDLKNVSKKNLDVLKKEYTNAYRAGGVTTEFKQRQQAIELKKELKKIESENKDLASRVASNRYPRAYGTREQMQAKIDSNNLRLNDINRELSAIPSGLGGGSPGRSSSSTPTSPATTSAVSGTRPLGGSADAMERNALAAAGIPTTPTTTTTSGTGSGMGVGVGRGSAGKPTRTRAPKLPSNWEAKFREMFPAQSWLLDIDRTKYPQLRATLERAIINKAWETPESAERFSAELDNTDFYKELASDQMVTTIKSLVGDLGFETVPFNTFLTNAMNFGWKGDVLKSEVYKEAFRKDDNGAYVNPTALARVKKSTDWLETARIGKAFFSDLGDSVIEQRLTGVLTDEDLIRQQRELAKTRYGHLSNLIDQGLSLEAISETYRQRAAAVLERDVNDIDMGTTDFEVAFNYGEEGKKRMMSSGEWEIMLRSDAKYGWDKTQNAKQEARGLASSIAQAFGRII